LTAFRPWKIVHCDLSRALPPAELEDGYEAAFIVLWWHEIPLGQLEIRRSSLPMPRSLLASRVAQAVAPAVGHYALGGGAPLEANEVPLPDDFRRLAALERPLCGLGGTAAERKAGGATVSVVVCTRDRPVMLERCLASLLGLKPAPQEILVIDNDPRSPARLGAAAYDGRIRHIPEHRVGLSIARNTGIRESHGDIVAFTDDDATVHPAWIARLQAAFDDARVMAVTGLVLPAELDTEAQWIFERIHGGFNLGYLPRSFDSAFYQRTKDRGVPAWSIGAGANMALRREAFDRAGAFDERLGAGAAGCSEDSEFWYRLLAEGCVCRYEPRAVVFHAHRRHMSELRGQYYRYMRGHVCALYVQYARYGDRGNLHRIFVALPRYYARLFLRLLRGRDPRRRRTFLAELGGWLTGTIRYGAAMLVNGSFPRGQGKADRLKGTE
jgi:glycosyltransferase involved in cell wall biosynthesis